MYSLLLPGQCEHLPAHAATGARRALRVEAGGPEAGRPAQRRVSAVEPAGAQLGERGELPRDGLLARPLSLRHPSLAQTFE